ncbi:TetR/AcrR family transcriptional regulator [Mycobacterium sp. 1274756.6]|uniref:TetR/AcrR family transcriptional regulator n=1 Tax=Mycobacterium sp. 1274756.6 TaxID=1834076 RepID=UPI000AF516D2|nr:TetR/AcrR family transcriptional regulator [Mycobacterium sp. 1274756.6]
MTSEATQRRRRAALAAATDLFGRKGWPVATADEIALAAGITKRTLYSYFGTKQGLLYEVGKSIIDVSRQRYEELSDIDGPPAEMMRTVVAGYTDLIFTFRVEYVVFLEEMKHLDDAQLVHVSEISDEWVALVRRIVEEGQESGDFDTELDAIVATFTILGMLNGMVYWIRREGTTWARADIAAQMAELVLNGLTVNKTR